MRVITIKDFIPF